MQYIDALGNWFVGIVALFIAICGQYLRRINLYPDLQLEVPERYLHKTFLGEQPNQVDAFYVSFIVRNNGNEAAEDVEVFVERTEITRQDGLFDDIGVQQPMNLRVAYGANYAITRTIHKKHFAYFNLGHIADPSARKGLPPDESIPGVDVDESLFFVELLVRPNSKEHLLRKGTYRLGIVIVARNSEPVRRTLLLRFQGTWSDTETEMTRECVGVEIV